MRELWFIELIAFLFDIVERIYVFHNLIVLSNEFEIIMKFVDVRSKSCNMM